MLDPTTNRPSPATCVALRFPIVLVLLCCGCAESPTWQDLDASQLTARSRQQLATAKTAAKALGQALKARLTKAVEAAGPVAAIDACHLEAPAITREQAATQSVRIGRTSHRLRNQDNAAPAWAAAHVAQAVAKPLLRRSSDGRLGVLLPIPTTALCTTCHGVRQSVIPAVREAVARQYPDDAAFGFAPGQLRGWFWVEVP